MSDRNESNVPAIGANDANNALRSRIAELELRLEGVLHELGANARKYGALRGSSGRVALDWSVQGGGGRILSLEWSERDGPPVAAPKSSGFGARLIEQSVKGLGGSALVDFDPAGLACRITVPLDRP